MPDAPSPPPDPAGVAWCKAEPYLEKLADAPDSPDSAGGLSARAPRMRPATRDRALRALLEGRSLIDAGLRALGHPSGPKVRPAPPRPPRLGPARGR